MQQHESENLKEAIEAAKKFGRFYCKFISANDVDLTGGHQVGIYIAKSAWNIFFENKGIKGSNKDKYIKVHINGFNPFDSRVIYYGRGTRNEYRITRFWSNSPYEKVEQVGNLIIFIPIDQENFRVFILNSDEDIENFIETFSLSLIENNAVYIKGEHKNFDLNAKLEQKIQEEASLYQDFPATVQLAELSRLIYGEIFKSNSKITADNLLLQWINVEYNLFHAIEKTVYQEYLETPFVELETLLEFAKSALNRRKSRAGKSLEHHVDYLLTMSGIPFSHPGKSEKNQRPDFILPSNRDYADPSFPNSKLTFLGAKTTCKDRWRQILPEADRIENKHLITLQQGISPNQLDEMNNRNVTLVVPESYHKLYPEKYRDRLWTVKKFLDYAREKYSV